MKISYSNSFFSSSHFIVFENGFCEPIHGHNFRVDVTVDAPLNSAGYTVDFGVVSQVLSKILQPFRERLLLPGKSDWLSIERNGSQIEISYQQPDGTPLFWSIPADHCVILDVANTTAELISQTIAQRLWDGLIDEYSLNSVEVRLEETPGAVAISEIGSRE